MAIDSFANSCVEEPSAAQRTELSPLETVAPRYDCLVVEDDPAQLHLLTQHLRALRLNVATATCIADAERRLDESSFHLAILDVQLPDGSGLDLCARIDEHPRGGFPTIMLSSMTLDSMVRQTRAVGGTFFLSKPYDPNVLLTLIERALGDNLQ